jgi:predicted nuclease of predicted toxin-antitoxin system
VDAQLPPALARWIASRGHAAEHVAVALAPRAHDIAIVRYAQEHSAVVVTKDADFLTLAPPPALLLVKTGNIPNRALFNLFRDRFDQSVQMLESGQDVVEIG